ncbi:hypothetical protein [Paraburkholderia terrae]|uniref:Uncharacterized protein n=1 Tax=Paraburkholderia terrae TaxID=311230 RepID=A0A2I8EYY6_9BURK|nr:hypothetical protein [Paraburkholderia terrae]AUT64658.1 hypothetical protein C2L65_33965 [Paraburkholderia terrae]
MLFVEIMVFHLMVRTKDQSIMEYHDTDAMTLQARFGHKATTCATQHPDGKAQKRKAAGNAGGLVF